jgi:hypothetical protein
MTVTRTIRATVTDISCTGARLMGSGLPPKGGVLELVVEQVRAFGTVAWSNGSECGVAFDDELTTRQVERLRRMAGIPSLAKLSVEERLALENWLLGAAR